VRDKQQSLCRKGAAMFFSKSARILAYVALMFGLLRILMGFTAATTTTEEGKLLAPAEMKRAFGTSTPGRAIDHGVYTILFAIALGTLAEISFSMRKRSTQEAE
jgi:hypothetical protein